MKDWKKDDRVQFTEGGETVTGTIVRVHNRYAANPKVRVKRDTGGETVLLASKVNREKKSK
jgi:hypothetical protein